MSQSIKYGSNNKKKTRTHTNLTKIALDSGKSHCNENKIMNHIKKRSQENGKRKHTSLEKVANDTKDKHENKCDGK